MKRTYHFKKVLVKDLLFSTFTDFALSGFFINTRHFVLHYIIDFILSRYLSLVPGRLITHTNLGYIFLGKLISWYWLHMVSLSAGKLQHIWGGIIQPFKQPIFLCAQSTTLIYVQINIFCTTNVSHGALRNSFSYLL